MYKYVLNLVIKISLMFAQYFEYYTIILRGAVFLWTQCIYMCVFMISKVVLLLLRNHVFICVEYRCCSIVPKVKPFWAQSSH